MPVLNFAQHLKSHTQREPARTTGRIYAIAVDLDEARAKAFCGAAHRSCEEHIACVLAEFGFKRSQRGVFFGDGVLDAVQCIMAVQELDRRYSWFGRVVRDLRMLRIEDNDDLLPALGSSRGSTRP